MPISKPYARIFRPYTKAVMIPPGEEEYSSDSLYVKKEEFESLLGAARLIVEDVIRVFDYVEPCDENFNVYSHRIYELFLRCATEFETNCKGILLANRYSKRLEDLNIVDFHKLNGAMKLTDYRITCDSWNTPRAFNPFEDWEKGDSLSWYQAYNQVKHNRSSCFQLANLKHLMLALCGLVVLLAAQFDEGIGKLSPTWFSYTLINKPNSFTVLPFTVCRPSFSKDESYEFDWKTIKNGPDPIMFYPF